MAKAKLKLKRKSLSYISPKGLNEISDISNINAAKINSLTKESIDNLISIVKRHQGNIKEAMIELSEYTYEEINFIVKVKYLSLSLIKHKRQFSFNDDAALIKCKLVQLSMNKLSKKLKIPLSNLKRRYSLINTLMKTLSIKVFSTNIPSFMKRLLYKSDCNAQYETKLYFNSIKAIGSFMNSDLFSSVSYSLQDMNKIHYFFNNLFYHMTKLFTTIEMTCIYKFHNDTKTSSSNGALLNKMIFEEYFSYYTVIKKQSNMIQHEFTIITNRMKIESLTLEVILLEKIGFILDYCKILKAMISLIKCKIK